MADLTPNNREEHWLKGMVDGQTTLEPNKRREYWYKEIVDAIGSGGGGGTGGGTLIVHINGEGVFDKTWQECADAIDTGIIVLVMIYSAETGHLYKILCGWDSEDGYAIFSVDNYSEPFAFADTANDYPRSH